MAGHAGQITDQAELVFDGRSIGGQSSNIDVAFVDGGGRIEVAQVCPVEFLKLRMEFAITYHERADRSATVMSVGAAR